LRVRDELLYSTEHVWVKVVGDTAVIGITDHAQDALGKIVFIELPMEGDEIAAADTFGVVESAKATSDLYAPVSGTIIAVNEDLLDLPEIINKKPYESWLIKVDMGDPDELSEMLDAQAYEDFCAKEA